MFLLALISGLINLSSQIVFQKVASMVVGDLYTTFIVVVLTFILGSALGSYLGNHFRRFLALIEIIAGCFSLAVFFLLKSSFYNFDFSIAALIGALLIPAFALGTHIPLYSYYLRRWKFGATYGVYHLGAVFGLLAVEWYFINAGSVQAAVLTIALSQLLLGVTVAMLFVRQKFVIEAAAPLGRHFFEFCQSKKSSIAIVFTASLISFYVVLWALKTQTMMTETYRLHATLISVAVFVWMAVAGALGVKFSPHPWKIFAGMAVAISLGQLGFPWVESAFENLNNGNLARYFAVSLGLSLWLTLPVLFSSLIFVRETSELQKQYEVDIASGTLNLVASIGNIAGFILGGLLASLFWTNAYTAAALLLSLAMAAILAWRSQALKAFSIASLVIVIIAVLAFQKQQKNFLFNTRIHPDLRLCLHTQSVDIFSHALTAMALINTDLKADAPSECQGLKPQRNYLVDGHMSHSVWGSIEFASGIAGAQYFTSPIEKSLVIGVGSGQAAWGVAAISEETDIVEISPIVMQNLDVLKDLNGDLLHKDRVKSHLADGFSFVRDCSEQSYDFIFNTSTYPSSFNASKLYSDEFVGLIKKCLRPGGVYQTYFDDNSVMDMQSLNEFLAPIQKHFKHVDVMLDPYPQVFAYDEPRNLQKISKSDFIEEVDFDYLSRLHPDEVNRPCRNFLRNVSRAPEKSEMNTLDRAFLERNSIRIALRWRYGAPATFGLTDFYHNSDGTPGVVVCE